MNLARLLQLASPTLPVGAYSYSQGLESAIEAGVVSDAASAQRWIADVLEFSVGTMDAPLLHCMLREEKEMKDLNAIYLASRETAELRAETLQMGYSLCRLLTELGVQGVPEGEVAYPSAFACAARSWQIEPRAAVEAYLWGWLESQVMAAVKAVPLGQTAGQRMLLSLGERLSPLAEKSREMRIEELCNLAPGLAMLSARHETQYSRIFRS